MATHTKHWLTCDGWKCDATFPAVGDEWTPHVKLALLRKDAREAGWYRSTRGGDRDLCPECRPLRDSRGHVRFPAEFVVYTGVTTYGVCSKHGKTGKGKVYTNVHHDERNDYECRMCREEAETPRDPFVCEVCGMAIEYDTDLFEDEGRTVCASCKTKLSLDRQGGS